MVSPLPSPTPAPASSGGKPAGRLFIGIGFLLSSLVTAGLGYVGQRYYLDYQNEQAEMLSKVSSFEKLSGDLPALASALNRKLKTIGQDPKKERDAVAANAREQYRALNDALPYIAADQREAAENYLTTMANLSEEVQKVTSPLDAGPYLQELAYYAQTRDIVVGELRRAAGLPVAVRAVPPPTQLKISRK